MGVFLIVFAVTTTYFILRNYGDAMLFSATLAFTVMSSVSLFALMHSYGDEPYYGMLTLEGLMWVFASVGVMVALSAFFVGLFTSALYFPKAFASVKLATAADSVFTAILGEMVFQLGLVATGEELLKFAAYTELKNRYKSTVLAVAVSVGLWAAFHALQAYRNIFYVIPAFLCGLVLLWLLEKTRSILAPIIAHGIYNTLCTLGSYTQTNMPLFPTTLTSANVILIGLAAVWIGILLLPAVFNK